MTPSRLKLLPIRVQPKNTKDCTCDSLLRIEFNSCLEIVCILMPHIFTVLLKMKNMKNNNRLPHQKTSKKLSNKLIHSFVKDNVNIS